MSAAASAPETLLANLVSAACRSPVWSSAVSISSATYASRLSAGRYTPRPADALTTDESLLGQPVKHGHDRRVSQVPVGEAATNLPHGHRVARFPENLHDGPLKLSQPVHAFTISDVKSRADAGIRRCPGDLAPARAPGLAIRGRPRYVANMDVPRVAVSVDLVILTVRASQLSVLVWRTGR